MFGFQSPAVELELAKTVRDDDLLAAKQYRLARAARRHDRGTARAKNADRLASSTPSARPAVGGIGAPRRSSG